MADVDAQPTTTSFSGQPMVTLIVRKSETLGVSIEITLEKHEALELANKLRDCANDR